MRYMTRRAALRMGVAGAVAGVLAPVVSACSSSRSSATGAQTPFNFQLSWIPGISWGGSYIALERGYYADEGLKVTVVPGGPNTAVEPLIAANKVLVGMTYGLGAATTNANGGDIKILGTQYQRSPTVIVSLPQKPIRTLQDLPGKTIGIPSDTTSLWQLFLARNG